MTALITSMRLPIRERARTLAQAYDLQTSNPSADAEARRLAAGVAGGNEAAFQELYDRYRDRLFRFALVLGHGDELLAGEIVQSVFVTAAAKLRRAESEEHLWNWLARVARQQLAKTWRRRQRESAVVSMADLPEYADSCQADSLLEENLDAALQEISAEDRQLIEWFYFDDLSHNDIAARLGATPKAVSSRLERARASLRACLTRKLSDET